MTKLRPFPLAWVVLIGVFAGSVYALSPMTVIYVGLIPLLFYWSGKGLSPNERSWVVGVVAVAALLRLMAVAAMFVVTDHEQVSFFEMFGDESGAKAKALWIRNAVWGIPLSQEDIWAAWDTYGENGFVYAAAAVQSLVGTAPYGMQLLNAMIYVVSAVVLHRVTRTAYGRLPAFVTLVVLLFLPSLFVWSVSALKEPSYYFLNALIVACALHALRAGGWRRRLGSIATGGLLILGISTLRTGAFVAPGAGLLGGGLAWTLKRRPRLVVLGAVALVLASVPVLARDSTRAATLEQLRSLGYRHWGHAASREGHGYALLDESMYVDGSSAPLGMDEGQAARFVVRGVASIVTVPWPWQAVSRAEMVHIPQQMLWYLLVALAIVGVVVGLRRHLVFTAVVTANALAAAAILSLTNGNIGTLVRTRDMVTPMLAILAGLGACVIGRWAVRAGVTGPEAATPDQGTSGASDKTVVSSPAPTIAVRRAWSASRTKAFVTGSIACRAVGRVSRPVVSTARWLWKGHLPEEQPLDCCDVVDVARRQWLIRAVERLASRLGPWGASSTTGRVLTDWRRAWHDRAQEQRVALVGCVIVAAAGAYTLLLGVASQPAPLGYVVAAAAATLGLTFALGARAIAPAWVNWRVSRSSAHSSP
jgi:hypothetical protein